jgi:hypothetical protein
MAHHSLRRAPGTWIGVVTPQDFEFLDLMQFRSIDGDTGGTWNPTAWIMIGGTYGIRIGATAMLDCWGNGNILGNVTLGSNTDNSLSVNALARFYAAAHCNGRLYAHENIVSDGSADFCSTASDNFIVRGTGHFYENVTFDKQITVTGNSNLSHVNTNSITVSDVLLVTGDTTIGPSDAPSTLGINSTTTLAGATTTTGPFTIGGDSNLTSTFAIGSSGSIAYRTLATGEAAPVASIADYDEVVCFSATTLYVQNWGDNGTKIRCVNAGSSTLNIRDSVTSGVLRALPAHMWIEISRNSTSGYLGWISLGEGPYVALG